MRRNKITVESVSSSQLPVYSHGSEILLHHREPQLLKNFPIPSDPHTLLITKKQDRDTACSQNYEPLSVLGYITTPHI